jgi:DNA-binding GntR family transcriptional regulator
MQIKASLAASLAVDSAAELFALRVIITRIALELSEQQKDVGPKEWMEMVAHDCRQAVASLQMDTLSEIEADFFRATTIDKILEILTGSTRRKLT